MKIEQLLVQHFYNSRKITLQGMGTFTLSPDFVMPKENDKDVEIPDHAIIFQYDPKAKEDEDLINYIVQQTRKMKPLATDDLDSFLVLGKQFLHIGKPFRLEGLGVLIKTQQGELEFIKGQLFQSKIENTPLTLKEKKTDTEISFASESKPTGNRKKGLFITLILLAVGAAGASAWYFLLHQQDSNKQQSAVVLNTDTLQQIIPKPDTQTIPPPPALQVSDGYTFKVVFFETADSAIAQSKFNVWTARGHKVIISKNDSLHYQVAEPFKLPLTDTARIKDSLNRYFYSGKGFIKIN